MPDLDASSCSVCLSIASHNCLTRFLAIVIPVLYQAAKEYPQYRARLLSAQLLASTQDAFCIKDFTGGSTRVWVSVRGTDCSNWRDFKNDAALLFSTNGFRRAKTTAAWLEGIIEKHKLEGVPIMATGHSLGGAVAFALPGLWSGDKTTPFNVVTFNTPLLPWNMGTFRLFNSQRENENVSECGRCYH